MEKRYRTASDVAGRDTNEDTSGRVPVAEWTDEEWLAVLRVVPPEADVSVGEAAVAEMRARR